MMRERFWELGQFFGCYLHQDWDLEATDWQGAVRNFLEHEPPERIRAVTTQLGLLVSLDLDDEPLHQVLLELGNAYYPGPEKPYRAWLLELYTLLREAAAGRS